MGESSARRRFEELPAQDRERYRVVGQQMVRLAQSYAVPIVYEA
jgi:hypothetical protein